MHEQDMEQPPLVPIDDKEDDEEGSYVDDWWEYDNEPPLDEPLFFDEDDEEEEEVNMEEEIKKWIAEHPGETIKYLAAHLDQMANTFGQSQTARYTRLLASEALKLHWMILGVDEAIQKLEEISGW